MTSLTVTLFNMPSRLDSTCERDAVEAADGTPSHGFRAPLLEVADQIAQNFEVSEECIRSCSREFIRELSR